MFLTCATLHWNSGLKCWLLCKRKLVNSCKTYHCCTTLDKIFPLQLVCVFMFRDDKLVPNCERYYCDAMCDSCVVPVSWINSIFLMGGGHNIWKALSVISWQNQNPYYVLKNTFISKLVYTTLLLPWVISAPEVVRKHHSYSLDGISI